MLHEMSLILQLGCTLYLTNKLICISGPVDNSVFFYFKERPTIAFCLLLCVYI